MRNNGVTYKPNRGRGRIRTAMLDHSATEQRKVLLAQSSDVKFRESESFPAEKPRKPKE